MEHPDSVEFLPAQWVGSSALKFDEEHFHR
jgi:hypothetical protein